MIAVILTNDHRHPINTSYNQSSVTHAQSEDMYAAIRGRADKLNRQLIKHEQQQRQWGH